MYILGDVHGQLPLYLNKYTFQLGDLGFDYKMLDDLNPDVFKFGQGNHDNHSTLCDNPPPHFVGRFGLVEFDGVAFYWIGGAKSIDVSSRTLFVNWWPNEELGHEEACHVLEDIARTNPRIIISHEMPCEIVRYLYPKQLEFTYTQRLLSEVYKLVQPELWVGGHHHVSYKATLSGTNFVGLEIGQSIKI